jgi:hypothetical protein
VNLGTGGALHSTCLGHDAMAGCFENGNENFTLIKYLLLIDVQRNYRVRKEDNIFA